LNAEESKREGTTGPEKKPTGRGGLSGSCALGGFGNKLNTKKRVRESKHQSDWGEQKRKRKGFGKRRTRESIPTTYTHRDGEGDGVQTPGGEESGLT